MTNNIELTKGFKREKWLPGDENVYPPRSLLQCICMWWPSPHGDEPGPTESEWTLSKNHGADTRVNGTRVSITRIPFGSSFLRIYSLNKRDNSQRLSAEWFKPTLHTYPWWVLLSNCTWQSKLKENWQGNVSKRVLTSALCRALWHVSRGSTGLYDRGTTMPHRPNLAGGTRASGTGKHACKAWLAKGLNWINVTGVWRDEFIEAGKVSWRKEGLNWTFMGVGRWNWRLWNEREAIPFSGSRPPCSQAHVLGWLISGEVLNLT